MVPKGRKKEKRPQKRWDDDIREVAGATWNKVAQDRSEWKRFPLPNVRYGSGTILVRNKKLEFANATVFLGVTLDNRPQWGPHISKLAKRLSSAAYAVKKIRNLSNIKTARLVYFGCFHSLISYGILLWGNAADSHRIFVLQKRPVRVIYKIGPRASLRNKFKEIESLTLTSQFI
ncbi:hypothetical protein EVAR_3807_1 [Eumeta japonica]|uniref:RNA-directed DNA polymerase from transposon BS n=1 Tax=Eumeta variegata TaxID=151549 RepID=A0A4C1SSN4_EUMVA|nr:hypothetical protein EVAR_3807_1 [Eumeta japonica]